MTYTPEELAAIFTAHTAWLRGEPNGQCANLSRANLYDANLYGANLTRANLTRANLTRANLTDADLRCTGNMRNIKTIQADIWHVGYTHTTHYRLAANATLFPSGGRSATTKSAAWTHKHRCGGKSGSPFLWP